VSVALARVSESAIDADEAEAAVLSIADGALVTFRGVVRDADDGRGVTALDYSAHPDAERFLAESCARIAAETGLAVAAVHRVGALRIGDVALVAAVAAPHRAEAFAACARLVDDIKSSVPIWKRQHYTDGVSDWVGL
jgi:molybdopterin synthase catalytic subunit